MLDTIRSVVSAHFELPEHYLWSADRHKTVAVARAIAIYFVRRMTCLSYPEIGYAFRKDHSTVIAADQKVKKALGSTEVSLLRAHVLLIALKLGLPQAA